MSTIIKSISFQNFYNYYGGFEKNTYRLTKGINIINADNNMGKSKFYNGILWILRDEVYDSDLKRVELASNSFIKMASGKALYEEDIFAMGVKIDFEEDKNYYSVIKSVNCKKENGEWTFQPIIDVSATINERTIPIHDLDEKSKIIQKIIPIELRNYALLQGESMEKLVDLSSRAGLSSTIETLAGISNLINLGNTCSDLRKKTKRLISDKEKESDRNSSRVNDLVDEREKLERSIDQSLQLIDKYNEELTKASEKKSELEALHINASKREQFREIKKNLLKEISDCKQQKNEIENNITSRLFSEKDAWLLMGLQNSIELFGQNRDNFIKSLALQNVINDPTILLPEGSPDIPSLKRMLELEKCEVCGRLAPKGSEHWNHIKMILERPSNTINKNCNDFSAFYGNIQKTVGSFVLNIPLIIKEIQASRDSINDLEKNITHLYDEYNYVNQEFMSAGGSDLDKDTGDTDKTNLNSYTLAERTITEKGTEIKQHQEYIKRWEGRISNIQKELEEANESDEINQYRSFGEIMSTIETMFLNTKERIFDNILDTLEKNANIKYQSLTSGNQVDGGKISFNKQLDKTVQVSIRSKNNNELTGLGTGFQRMKQLSIIMAIISSKIGNKHFDYPFISDAPFSEFGDNFIYNFFNVAPDVFSQTIILIKDLYDPNSSTLLNEKGENILAKMKNGDINGTFYVNVIEEKSDASNLTTTNKCYYPDKL